MSIPNTREHLRKTLISQAMLLGLSFDDAVLQADEVMKGPKALRAEPVKDEQGHIIIQSVPNTSPLVSPSI